MSTKRAFGLALLCSAALWPSLQLPAFAATGDTAESVRPKREGVVMAAAFEEVVVSARKRPEPLQKVPIAITAFTAADLAKRPVTALVDIQKLTPNLSFRMGTEDPFSAPIALRGQYTTFLNLAGQPSVGVYYDDVYRATASGVNSGGFFDISQIEVLKGAQGTLYGRNSTGGAIKIQTPLPDYSGFNGKVKFGYGDYGQNEEGVAINLPLVDQKLTMRVSGDHLAHDGYGHIIGSNIDLNDADTKAIKAALRFDASDVLRFVFRSDWSYSSSHGLANNLLSVGPLTSPSYSSNVPRSSFYNEAVALGLFSRPGLPNAAAGRQALLNDLVSGGSQDAYSAVSDPSSSLREGGVSLTGIYEFNDYLTLKSITAYRGSDETATNDDFGVRPIESLLSGTIFDVHSREITQELQLTGKALDSKLKYALGYFFLSTDGEDKSDQTSFNALVAFAHSNANPLEKRSEVTDTSHAVYGQGSYALTDSINVTAGLRWTTESVGLVSRSFQGNPTPPYSPAKFACANAPGFQLPLPGPTCYKQYPDSDFRNLSYTFGLDWSPIDNILAYAKTDRGFKAGGVNTSGFFSSFGPEIVTDYEVGLKTDWLNKKLRVNATGFYSEFSGLQRNVTDVRTVAGVSGAVVSSAVVNAATAEVSGLEFESTARPLEGVEIQGNVAYLLPKYLKFDTFNGRGQPVNLVGSRFVDQAKWKTFLSAAYTYPLEFGTLRSNIDWSYTSSLYLGTLISTPVSAPVTTQKGYSLFDARIAVNIDKYDLEIAGWIRNLADEKYLQTTLDLTSSFGLVSGSLGNPRTFGIELTKYF